MESKLPSRDLASFFPSPSNALFVLLITGITVTFIPFGVRSGFPSSTSPHWVPLHFVLSPIETFPLLCNPPSFLEQYIASQDASE